MIFTILFWVWMISIVVWLYQMNRKDADLTKTKQMKEIFITPQGFVIIFLTSPLLLIVLFVSDAIKLGIQKTMQK